MADSPIFYPVQQQQQNGVFDSFARAFLMGQQMRQQQQALEMEKQDRALKIEAFQQEAKRLKLEDKIRAFQLLQGQRGPMTEQAGPEIPNLFSAGGQMGVPTTQQVEGRHPSIDFSEIQPGLRLQPQNLGDMLALEREKRMRELQAKVAEAAAMEQAKAGVARAPQTVEVPGQGPVTAPANVLPDIMKLFAEVAARTQGQQFTAGENEKNRASSRQNALISAGGQTVNVDTVDAQGNPVTTVLPKGQAVGKSFPKAPTGEAATSRRNAQIALRGVDEITAAFNPDWVGPFTGRTYAARETVGAGVDSKRSEFAAAVAVLNNQVINALSGAAVSASEYNRLKRQIPLVTDPPKVFQSKLEATRKNLERISNPTATGTPDADPLGLFK